MHVRLRRLRRLRLVAVAVAAPLLSIAAAGAASAHGAPVSPVSRSYACGSEGKATQKAACKAARDGDEGQWFRQWDNVRVANVAGRDRQTIPDGQLCSGGIDNFGGLDLARTDWPQTNVRAGSQITVRYRATIPHQGTFRVYVTKDGYDPSRRLRWADLEAKPFLTRTDPRFEGGAYAFTGKLPRGKVGRNLIFTIWQNSSTPDTYYSCSDVVFTRKSASTGAAGKSSTSRPSTPAKPGRAATPKPSVSPLGSAASTDDASTLAADRVSAEAARDQASGSGDFRLRLALAALALLSVAVAATFALRSRRG